MQIVLAVAFGGAFGAVGRHFMNVAAIHWFGHGFPWGTILVNILGSFLMGCLVSLLAHVWQPSMEIKAFLTVGLLGAFTTFSTFSLDIVTLFERQDYLPMAGYMAGSLCLSILGLILGMFLIRIVVL